MGTSTIIVLLVLALIVFGIIGFMVYSWAENSYGYNIFNIGILSRWAIGVICGAIFFVVFYDTPGHETMSYFDLEAGYVFLLILGSVMFLWNFIDTQLKTNVLIAFLSVVYQLFGIYLFMKIIGKILNFINGD